VPAAIFLSCRYSVRKGIGERQDAERVAAHFRAVGLPDGLAAAGSKFCLATPLGISAARRPGRPRRPPDRPSCRDRSAQEMGAGLGSGGLLFGCLPEETVGAIPAWPSPPPVRLSQSEKFDAGDYIRQWVPELKNVSDAAIHDPEEDWDQVVYCSDACRKKR
jgi:hypothetical protein